jgi:hypothetical protein
MHRRADASVHEGYCSRLCVSCNDTASGLLLALSLWLPAACACGESHTRTYRVVLLNALVQQPCRTLTIQESSTTMVTSTYTTKTIGTSCPGDRRSTLSSITRVTMMRGVAMVAPQCTHELQVYLKNIFQSFKRLQRCDSRVFHARMCFSL